MSDRRGVAMILYDLPSTTKKQKREYRALHKHLIKSGYSQLQESIYIKVLQNIDTFALECAKIYSVTEPEANISAIPLSINSFLRMKVIRGKEINKSLISDEIVVI